MAFVYLCLVIQLISITINFSYRMLHQRTDTATNNNINDNRDNDNNHKQEILVGPNYKWFWSRWKKEWNMPKVWFVKLWRQNFIIKTQNPPILKLSHLLLISVNAWYLDLPFLDSTYVLTITQLYNKTDLMINLNSYKRGRGYM